MLRAIFYSCGLFCWISTLGSPTKQTWNMLSVHHSPKHFSICLGTFRSHIQSGWWFGTFFIFPYIGNVIIPIDFHIFQRGGPTTNQQCCEGFWFSKPGFFLNSHANGHCMYWLILKSLGYHPTFMSISNDHSMTNLVLIPISMVSDPEPAYWGDIVVMSLNVR